LFNQIRFDNWRGDLFGGVTAAIVSLPLALAFGVASGIGPVAGLYGAVIIGLFAALFGGTPTLISEPTGPMTVVMAAVVTAMMARYPEQGVAMAFTVVMIAGLFQILLGSLRLGKYITLMPYSVISGFMSGIGVILIVLQIAPFLGQPSPPGGVLGTLTSLPQLIQEINPVEAMLGGLTLAVLFGLPRRWKRYAPPQLVALILVTLLSLTLFGDAEIRRIGEIPTGLPQLYLPTFTPDMITQMIVDGMVLGMLGCIDSLLTAVIADSLTRTEHDANKELIGQGMGNLAAGLLGGLPGAGATMGTVVSIQSGARSALAGLIRVGLLLVMVFGAAPLIQPIPLAVLAGIALMVGVNILDWSFIQRAHRVSWLTTAILYGVMLLTVFWDLIVAVGVGVFIANILTIERLSEHQSRNLKAISDADDGVDLSPQERDLLEQAGGRVLLFYLSGPMVFGVSKAISRQHTASRNYDALVFDLSNVPMLSVTVSLAIENAIKDSLEAGQAVYVVARNKAMLEQMEIASLLPPHHLTHSRMDALRLAVDYVVPPFGLTPSLSSPAAPPGEESWPERPGLLP
jgi:SulP family sulfate permease